MSETKKTVQDMQKLLDLREHLNGFNGAGYDLFFLADWSMLYRFIGVKAPYAHNDICPCCSLDRKMLHSSLTEDFESLLNFSNTPYTLHLQQGSILEAGSFHFTQIFYDLMHNFPLLLLHFLRHVSTF
jgi:hypothetical protein